MNAHDPSESAPTPGSVEYEFGVPIPGAILPPEKWARTALKKIPLPPLNFEEIFGRKAPVIVDLGCGNGRYTLLSALARPQCDHFAIDVLPAVIRYATRRGNQRGLSNARFAVKDNETFMKLYAAPGSVAEVHLYHPQPFHDQREANRRTVAPKFLADVHKALQPSGIFIVQTDSPDYWHYMERVLPAFFKLEEHPNPWPDAPEGRSRREILSRSRGLKIFRGVATRRDDLSAEAIAQLLPSLPMPTFRTYGPWSDLDAVEMAGEGGGGGDARGGRRQEKRGRRFGGGRRRHGNHR
jgi:tRNA (guanine-N7-)-methyltransferase